MEYLHMDTATFITAIGTPLTEADALHPGGLEAQLADQEAGGIKALLVGGTMGIMQMLTDQVWKDLVDHSTSLGAGRFEIMVGVGDTSFARTRDRIAYLNDRKGIDAVVVLAPYFMPLSQEELTDYFVALADESNIPLYLYDLPVITGLRLEIPTVCKLAAHRNIAGIKCSDEFSTTRRLIDCVGDGFRVIVAKPEMIDAVLHHGVTDNLDGMFAVFPHWVTALGKAAAAGKWDEAARWQQKMNQVRRAMIDVGVWGGFTAIMNARGIPGRFAPRPVRMLDDNRKSALLESGPVTALLNEPVMATE
jgi:4-hydroxy-tetrahydrodipicolinate synthase